MTLIQDDLKNLEILNSSRTFRDMEKIIGISPTLPFSEESIDYLSQLSKEINKFKNIKDYPDIATFAFFAEKPILKFLKNKFFNESKVKIGRGIIFHIAPSNVPVNFAFSLVTGILSGNSNIVKVPSKKFTQIDIISNAMNKIANDSEYKNISIEIFLIRYDRNSNATKYFSSLCDVRIIWGGDETIKQVRKFQLQPRSFDISFSDRYSICIINAEKYINELKPKKIAKGF